MTCSALGVFSAPCELWLVGDFIYVSQNHRTACFKHGLSIRFEWLWLGYLTHLVLVFFCFLNDVQWYFPLIFVASLLMSRPSKWMADGSTTDQFWSKIGSDGKDRSASLKARVKQLVNGGWMDSLVHFQYTTGGIYMNIPDILQSLVISHCN